MPPTHQGNDQQATPICHRLPARIMLWEERVRLGTQSRLSGTISMHCRMGSRPIEVSRFCLRPWWSSACVIQEKVSGCLCSRSRTGLANVSCACQLAVAHRQKHYAASVKQVTSWYQRAEKELAWILAYGRGWLVNFNIEHEHMLCSSEWSANHVCH